MSDTFAFSEVKKSVEHRMGASVDALFEEMKNIRTGRANPQLLEPVMVEAYNGQLPMAQVATVSVQGARSLSVAVWDSGLVPAVEKAIRGANLGLNPVVAGTNLRIQLPDLTEERRKEYAKLLQSIAEKTRVAVRAVRRSGMDVLKKAEKDKQISEDDLARFEKEVQALTDATVKRLDIAVKDKEKELMTL